MLGNWQVRLLGGVSYPVVALYVLNPAALDKKQPKYFRLHLTRKLNKRIMKKINLFIIIILLLSTSCEKEHFIPEGIKKAFPVDYYNVGDTLKFSYQLNDKPVDSIYLVIEKNRIYIHPQDDGIGITTYNVETYTFEAFSLDRNHSIDFQYYSMDNNFSGNMNFNEINFTLDIIEKEIESITIDNVLYNNVFLLKSEYQEDTYAHISNNYGLINIVTDSIKLIPFN